ncbi:MAG: zinc ABC transporter substrate-binding protein [Rhodospirillales bacterium]
MAFFRPMFLRMALAIVLITLGSAQSRAEQDLSIAVTIAPIHSLVAGVLGDAGTAHLVIKGGGSPHAHALRPSEARALMTADRVFWVGPNLETFLADRLNAATAAGRLVTLIDTADLVLLPFRDRDLEDDHHDHEDDHHEHDDGHHHEAGGIDPHLWLDPLNAIVLVEAIRQSLTVAAPAKAATFAANAQALTTRLQALNNRMEKALAPVKARPFLVFHDAYQYLEHRFGLQSVGAITLSPDRAPGAKRIGQLQDLVHDSAATCVFTEPQFEPRLAALVVEGTSAKLATLDPLGADIAAGPQHYETLMRRNLSALTSCLSPQG